MPGHSLTPRLKGVKLITDFYTGNWQKVFYILEQARKASQAVCSNTRHHVIRWAHGEFIFQETGANELFGMEFIQRAPLNWFAALNPKTVFKKKTKP